MDFKYMGKFALHACAVAHAQLLPTSIPREMLYVLSTICTCMFTHDSESARGL